MAPTPSNAQCAKCGYELVGLGHRGTCPECGAYFDKTSGKGLASPGDAQAKVDWFLRRLRTVALALFAVSAVICGGAIKIYNPASRAIYSLLVLAGVLALGALTSYLYERD